jgi:hypothetical protein
MAPGFKTGGRTKGTPNKPRPIILASTGENRELLAMAAVMRTPKAVMLDAMLRFESIGLSLLAKAERLAETKASASQIAMLATEGHKFMIAAVQCADKVAPYIHARLLAVESRGDMTEDKAPYVIRAPMVMDDSSAWQAAVGAALGEAVASTAPSGAQAAPLAPPVPDSALVAKPVSLVADLKTGGISTIMPAAQVTVRPTRTQEWLDAVAAGQRKAVG